MRAPLAIHFTLGTDISAEGATNGETDFVAATIDVHGIDLRLEADMVPTFGIQWDLGELNASLDGLRIGASARGQASMDIDVVMDGQINASLVDSGELNATTLALVYYSKVHVLDHFLPAQVQGGIAYSPAPALDVFLDAQVTNWKAMELNIAQIEEAVIEATMADLETSDVVDGNPLDVSFRNTATLKAGIQLRLPEWNLGPSIGRLQLIPRGGFSYEPSPLVSQSADSALLDSDRLIFALGLGGVHHATLLGEERRLDWDVFGQLHTLANGSLTRDSGGEPQAGYPRDSTSLPIGGRVFIAGVQGRYQY